MMPPPDSWPSLDPGQPPAVRHSPRSAAPAFVAAVPALSANPDPIALLKALRRRWPLAMAAGLLASTIVAGAAYFLIPSAKYTARAMLHVNSITPRIILQVREAVADYGAYQRTQLALLKSRLVLNAALKQDGVSKLPGITAQPDPIEWLEQELQVDFANGSEILRIGMSGQDAAGPMILVNAVTQAYLDEVVNVEAQHRRERYELLKETWSRYQENLRDKRKELKRLTEMTGSDDKMTVASIQQHEIERLGRVEDELARIQSELRSLSVEYQVLQEEEAIATTSVSPAQIENEINMDQSIEFLNERIAQAKRSIDQVSRLVRIDSDPSIQRHRKELETLRATHAAQRQKLYPIIAQQLQERTRGDRSARAAMLEGRIKILSGIEDSLTAEIRRLSERRTSISRTSLDLFSIQEEIENAEDVAKTIGTEVEALTVELKAPPRIRLLEKAELPRTKDELRPLKLAGVAGCVAFALVLAGVALWEFQARRVDSPDDVTRGLGITLVGTLPALPSGGLAFRSGDARGLRWQNLLIESVDAVRTNLLHVSRTDSIRVVMVASALGGEGKTSLASHLTLSLARASRRTLLIDGDLRRPSAHRLFDLPPGPGLSEVLRGETEIEDVIQSTLASGVWMVPAGRCDSRAIQALASKDLRTILDRLAAEFDFIVFDSSPVLPVADALLIGQHVDAVLFSVMRDVSRMPKVHAAYERMSTLGIRMLGAIVTGGPAELYGNDYQYVSRSHD